MPFLVVCFIGSLRIIFIIIIIGAKKEKENRLFFALYILLDCICNS